MTMSQRLNEMLFLRVCLEITIRRRWNALTRVQPGVQAHVVEKFRRESKLARNRCHVLLYVVDVRPGLVKRRELS